MSENLFSVIHTWVNRWQNWQHPEAAGLQEDAPLRAELFSAEQMVRHGKVLARSHKLAKRTYPDRLLKRLEDNERVLVRCCQLLQASTQTQQLPPAGEWLLDNYYLVEEQIHLIRQSLPKKYGRGLPRLSNANQQGIPRVYDIALEAIAHGDGHWDADSFSGFISAYQTLSDLSLGELWALPIMLRLALIENLRRIALCQIDDVQQISLAIVWAERLLSVAQAPSDQQLQAVAEMAAAQLPLTYGFIAEFTRRLQGKGAALTLATDWLTLRLQEQGKTIESAVQMQAQLQATRQLSVSNSISSLRHLDEMNWPEFVETMSVTEQILRTDPCGVYAQMDFTTRDTYRHVIERLARSGRDKYSEPVVARKLLEQAQQAASRYAADDRRTHVGYYLIGDGLAAVETMFGVRRGVRATLRQTIKKYALHVYVSAVIVGAMLPVWLMAYVSSPVHWLLQAVLGVSGLIAFSQLALSLINEVLTRQVRPAHLPKVDYSQGLPPECRSLVAVPMLLRSKAQIDEAVAALEVRYLANPDTYLHFALLTDFTDASQQIMPEDGDLLAHAKQHILNLNQRINSDSRSSVFFLLHRDRCWNEGEQCWMGYERKRGKLAALNAFLLGRDADAFDSVTGRRAVLSNVRYVITLDLDTQLPPDAARQLIGTLAHPLNQAVYDPICQRVITGYAILQPRIAEVIPEQGPNRYTQICGAESGLDPYTRTVSDVYQDLFGEGSFIGKGIYDLAVFERVLSDRWPDNQVLSHDLLEGCYARSGLISDITLYEPPVENYLVDVARRSRWIRGDWQLLPWLRRKLRNTQGQYEHNTLSALSQWKLFDNLRRSMVPAATLTLLISSVLLCSPAVVAILLAVLLVGSPLVALLLDVAVMPAEISLYQYWRLSVKQMFSRLRQRSLELLLLPFDAYYQTKAIMTAVWRMWVSHAGLLEWTTAEVAQQNAKTQASVFYRRMWFSVVCSLVIPAAVLWLAPHNVLMAFLLGVGWLIVPALLAYISQPVTRKNRQFDASQQTYLRQLSRETWGFFETFVNADENYLPPDNFQEVPEPVVAHRTSPTNIGLSLLANLTAFDFGYITRHNLLQRCTLTLNTLDQLGRYRGHFYNWYDTQTLRPLYPRYISTVDSGNLAGHLLILRRGLLALRVPLHHDPAQQNALHTPPDIARFQLAMQGMTDTLNLLCSALADRASPVCEQQISALKTALVDDLTHRITDRDSAHVWFGGLYQQAFALNLYIQDTYSGSVARRWSQALVQQLEDIQQELALSQEQQQQQNEQITQLAARLFDFAQMDFEFLFDPAQQLLRVGYNLDSRHFDQGHYDLLQSEARLGHFLAVALHQIPVKSWFNLGRLLSVVEGRAVLASWSGSMFEYLMPQLVMPSYHDTMITQTCRNAVLQQISYGKQMMIPWGISESGYNQVDGQFNYQYRAFGVPGLGLKRGLTEDRVIAPYATMMALMLEPDAACQNLQALQAIGARGAFGFYEALDFTPSRLNRGEPHVLIRSYMAHHQGMGFLALAHQLLGQKMPQRFTAEPLFRAAHLLLQEKMPKAINLYVQRQQFEPVTHDIQHSGDVQRRFYAQDLSSPEIQLLSNSRYHVMLSQSGAGYSRWQNLALTRWRADPTTEKYGLFCYIRDLDTGSYSSISCQPLGVTTELFDSDYQAVFSESKVEYQQALSQLKVHTEVVVSPEDDVELRRITLTNLSYQRKEIELTSYAEVVLAPLITDQLHPAFSNLFMQTEIVGGLQTLLCHRRARTAKEQNPWLFHQLNVHDSVLDGVSYETDRAKFIGRGRSAVNPLAMQAGQVLSNSQGAVLDPVVAIRRKIVLEPNAEVTVDLLLGIAPERELCLQLAEKYHDRHLADRITHLAWTHSQVFLHQINTVETETLLFNRLAGLILFPDARLRAAAEVLAENRLGQSGLWPYAISGDYPIVLLFIHQADGVRLMQQLVQAHAYLRLKGFAFDLVILNEEVAGYRQELQTHLGSMLTSGPAASCIDQPAGVFLRASQAMPADDRRLLQSVAALILDDQFGSLPDQLSVARSFPRQLDIPENISPARETESEQVCHYPQSDLRFFNGLGGFSTDGREYVMLLDQERRTPVPWSNILANPRFGSVISESGQAYTWYQNAHEYRLTPWNNDPVSDSSGEAFYIRDQESGQVWSPTALPCPGTGEYRTRHGFGYSLFEHTERGITSELRVFVARERPVKFFRLKLINRSTERRRLSITGFVEWILGDLKNKTAAHVVTSVEPQTRAVLARNSYNQSGDTRTVFFDVNLPERTLCTDRRAFLGALGRESQPVGLNTAFVTQGAGNTASNNGKTGAVDPCAALQVSLMLLAGEEREVVFMLGAEDSPEQAVALLQHLRGIGADSTMPLAAHADQEFATVQRFWHTTLGALQVTTPEPELDLLLNGWLLYQTLTCRFEARSGYYQSGGAFGFRDQLQDCMALVHAAPQLLRQHLLLAASRQFSEGDVQHWWHPPMGQGVRTRCSDDYLWLPYVLCHYVASTSDISILHEPIRYLQGRSLREGEESYYDAPQISDLSESLYQHAVRAVMHGLRFGVHGLPLMGSGDWNDGMDQVGIEGKGESVWLGFFLYDVLQRFADLAERTDDLHMAALCLDQAQQLQANLETSGWDGQWYRRAYFDDGTPLGSASNIECRIDSIAQSWSVLSESAALERSRLAMHSLNTHLVRRPQNIIQLLDPPFDQAALNPGYIKGYVPGVRENGGQYTHSAVWATMAFAKLGDKERAWELTRMLNPINHGKTLAQVAQYKVEPYVAAADIYAVEPHTGRGGWTWYTGSAGWMYRLMSESLLGIRRSGTRLLIEPCLPEEWESYSLRYQYQDTLYLITVSQVDSDAGITIDGVASPHEGVQLHNDRKTHQVSIRVLREKGLPDKRETRQRA